MHSSIHPSTNWGEEVCLCLSVCLSSCRRGGKKCNAVQMTHQTLPFRVQSVSLLPLEIP